MSIAFWIVGGFRQGAGIGFSGFGIGFRRGAGIGFSGFGIGFSEIGFGIGFSEIGFSGFGMGFSGISGFIFKSFTKSAIFKFW